MEEYHSLRSEKLRKEKEKNKKNSNIATFHDRTFMPTQSI